MLGDFDVSILKVYITYNINTFFQTFNENIKFTIEKEENNEISFPRLLQS